MNTVPEISTIEVPCPRCGHKLTVGSNEVEANPKFTCPACGGEVDATAGPPTVAPDPESTRLLDLQKTVERLNK
jgi:endogenous inhibitor of DNA gyrase (YacG/DUF329 family)